MCLESSNKNNQGLTNRSWKKVLLHLYQVAPHGYLENSKITFSNPQHALVKDLRIPPGDVAHAINFLEDNGLITRSSPEIGRAYSSRLHLTTKGFDVALDLEKHKDTGRLEFSMILLTGILVLTEVFTFLREQGANKILSLIIYLFAIILLGIFSFYLKK